MQRTGATVRFVAGLALALGLAAALATFAGSRAQAQENGQASITIYTAICPAGFSGDDLFGACYDNPGADITYELTASGATESVAATSDANGFAAFEGLTVEGQYVLQNTLPGDFVDLVARCSEDGADFPLTPGEHFGQYLLNLTTDNDIRCDFYVIGEDQNGGEAASITIYKATCPAGYTGDNFFEDCYDNATAGVRFFLNVGGEGALDATTDANGFAAFEGLVGGGTVILGENEFDEFFVLCSKGGENFPIEYLDSAIQLELTPDDDIRCDWYNIPAAGGETPTVAPTQAPKPTSTVAVLPNTGAGGESGGGGAWPLAGALALLVVAAGGLATTRLRLGRAEVRGRR